MERHISPRELRIDTAHLDCLQAGLAVAAHHLCGTPGEDLLGGETRFRPRPAHDPFGDGGSGLPTVEPTLADQLARADRALGLRHGPTTDHACGADLLDAVGPDPLFVVGDAHALPWVPYHGHRHTGHGFLLRTDGPRYELTDAYANRTPWGDATPRAWTLDRPQVIDWLSGTRLLATPLSRAPGATPAPVRTVLTATAADLRAATRDGRTAAYVEAHRGGPDRAAALEHLVLETWLLARQRAALARLDPALQRRSDAWRELAEQTYVAMRRAARGRPVPATVFDDLEGALHADADALDAALDVAVLGV